MLSMSDLCSGEGEGLIVEWCLCELLQDLSCSWPHHTQHSIVRGDVAECDRGREVTGDPGSHVGHMRGRTHYKVPEEGGGGGGKEEGGRRGGEGGGRCVEEKRERVCQKTNLFCDSLVTVQSVWYPPC